MYLEKLITMIIRESIQDVLPAILQKELQQLRVLKEESEESLIINIDEVCRITGYKKQTIYCLVSDSKSPYIKRPGSKFLRFNKAEILEWYSGTKTSKS